METLFLIWFLGSIHCCFALPTTSRHANQISYLDGLVESIKSSKVPHVDAWPTSEERVPFFSPVYLGPQDGLMEEDKIEKLPGQPSGVYFSQYAGYVTVEPKAGRALFYYLVESSQDPATKPLVLWLNGGPGCSSLGYGAMEELGPFRVKSDGKTLYSNDYAWNHVANVLFLESPAGVGFSYSNTTSDYDSSGDERSARDAYTFLINWLQRFPQYKTRDFYITGESYGGHYVPQLAYTILYHNKKNAKQTVINLKGIAVGNAWIDYETNNMGMYDYFWTHALNSDEYNAEIHAKCDFSNETSECIAAQDSPGGQLGNINIYDIYAPLCHGTNQTANPSDSILYFDPCTDDYVYSYMNLEEVQKALHANVTGLKYPWDFCSPFVGFSNWKDTPKSLLPTIKQLISTGIRVWLYSGDTDGRCPVTSSRYFINKLGLPIKSSWRPWYSHEEVGGYVVGYEGLAFVTVRGAGHMVPSYKPQRALTMISSFLKGALPPII